MNESVKETSGGRLATNDSEQAKNMPANHKNDKFNESVTHDIDGQQVKYAKDGAGNLPVWAKIEQQRRPIRSTAAMNQNINRSEEREVTFAGGIKIPKIAPIAMN